MDIPEIHQEILELFKKYKYNWDTGKLSFESFTIWSDGVSQLLKLDKNKIYSRLSELFWSISSVQLSIGYALIARNTCRYPKGVKGEAFDESSVPNMIGISEIHLYYHLNNGWESVYRCWERLSSLLQLTIYPNLEEKYYFDNIVNIILNDEKLPINAKAKELRDQIKYWNKNARLRNKVSHFESSPMKKVKYEPGLAKIYGSQNEFIPKISYSSQNIIIEINELRDSYYRIIPALLIVKEYIEQYIVKKIKEN